MIWNWHFPRVKQTFEQATGEPLQAGITVLVRVQVNFSELYGISLFVDDIDPAFTLGEKALERRRAIERLTAAGYMELQKELALPDVPYRLAVITSKTAAGYQDFRNHIRAALLEAGEQPYDAILILRGGGSELDLACFDDYDLAVAIATCPVPVITAIGHDKDVHIADMVAHASVKTPTALADLFLQAYKAQDALLDRACGRIGMAATRLVNREELRLKSLDARVQQSVQRRIGDMDRQVNAVQARIRLALTKKLSAQENALLRAAGRISRGLTAKYTQVARLRPYFPRTHRQVHPGGPPAGCRRAPAPVCSCIPHQSGSEFPGP